MSWRDLNTLGCFGLAVLATLGLAVAGTYLQAYIFASAFKAVFQ